MNTRLVIAGFALAALLAGCTDVVDGAGNSALTAGPAGGSSTPAFPGPTSGAATPTAPGSTAPRSTSVAQPPTTCPHVVYPAAKLAFDCMTTGLKASYNGKVWPLQEYKTVEKSTGWVAEQGAGHWGSSAGQSLEDIALNVRQQMIDAGGYGDNPTRITVADRAMTVDGHIARLLQTTFTINRAWARSNGTKVEQEKLWLVAIEVGAGDVSLWYASVPDLAKSLWPQIPSAIASIRVG
jgi:hypothetical protein